MWAEKVGAGEGGWLDLALASAKSDREGGNRLQVFCVCHTN